MKRQNAIPGKLRPAQLAMFLAAPVLCAFVCLCVGRMNVPVKDLIAALRGHDIGRQKDTVLWSMRLPRVLLAALIGAGLSVSAVNLTSETSAENNEPIMIPDRIIDARDPPFPIRHVSPTAARPKQNAVSCTPTKPNPSSSANAAPKLAPLATPNVSGVASGFANML